jgi:flavin reductase (DIM6/NTAB) family NADH-FMN oxidoreductase RutF
MYDGATSDGRGIGRDMTAESAIDARMYRDTIGRFATGVTVITWDDGAHVRGMTANAVSSLSLDPMMLLVCVDKKASAHDQLEVARAFAVNILAADQIEVSKAFARHGVADMADARYTLRASGAPILDGALAWIECEIAERLPGGDHTIYLGRVVDLEISRPEADPLLFFGGRYRSLAPEADA